VNRIVRIAAGQGFWGDWLEAPRRQVEGGPIDYLMLDYLAEVTMSILQKQMQRDPLAGYARDFITQMEGVLPAVVDRGIRVTANAGGVNPRGCADALLEMARGVAHHDRLRVGVVTGDDLLPRIDELSRRFDAAGWLGRGLLRVTEGDATAARDAGVLVIPVGDLVQAAPPFTIGDDELDEAFARLKAQGGGGPGGPGGSSSTTVRRRP